MRPFHLKGVSESYDAPKGARRVREGAVGNGLASVSTALAAYFMPERVCPKV
jgi:hypothetical protein